MILTSLLSVCIMLLVGLWFLANFDLFQVLLHSLSTSFFMTFTRAELSCSQSDVLKWCHGDECCRVSPVKTLWHTASVLNHQLSTRDPLNFCFSFYICSLFLCWCTCQSPSLVFSSEDWQCTKFPPLCVDVFVYPCAHGSSRLLSLCNV